ncbi:hypothetical protein SCHPADRAFT_924501 [Schizopora paradoxa]|uniref:NADH dehydrogenase [ubiquinone] 1 alpha subcomplex subunit n=1 Tax=Schizopora paradoxa TaxID=27342 RepID=A0A0H2S5S5_9AGAM|nr:hypothetical protein SCHPADRAFT_924501 [Schizopora paradoxa]
MGTATAKHFASDLALDDFKLQSFNIAACTKRNVSLEGTWKVPLQISVPEYNWVLTTTSYDRKPILRISGYIKWRVIWWDSRRTRRIVKYQGKRDLLEYATDGKQLAAQWRAWLSHTRIQPPTLQDLQRDLERQRQIMHNAAIIEARDNEERRRLSEARSPSISEPVSSKSEHTHAPSVASASSSSAAPQKQFSPWVPQPDHYEPQSWTPRSSMRGQ